jgi:hypothetical protein
MYVSSMENDLGYITSISHKDEMSHKPLCRSGIQTIVTAKHWDWWEIASHPKQFRAIFLHFLPFGVLSFAGPSIFNSSFLL